MMKALFKRKIFLKGAMVPIVLITILLFFGTVCADDGGITVDPVDVPAEETIAQDGEEPTETVVENSDAPPAVIEDVLPDESENDEIPSEEPAAGETDEGVIPEPDMLAEDGIVDETNDLPLPDSESASDEVVLVNGEGETLDMASEANLEVFSSADPWWIVSGVKYAYIKTGGTCPADTTAGVTCFESATPITGALSYMDANNLVPSDGILHVEPDDYTDNIIVNGLSGNGYLANLKGVVSEGNSSNTTLTGLVQISNTLLGFTLSGFTIDGYINLNNNIGTLTLTDINVASSSNSGIYAINQNGAVKVENVKSSNNKYWGMYVDNTAGTYPITITNSEFNFNDDGVSSNYWGGLRAVSNSTITLNGVSASNNDGNGAWLIAAKGTTVKNSVFNYNFSDPGNSNIGYGLAIYDNSTANNILLENVVADGNDHHGILLSSSGNVTLTNVSADSNSAAAGYDGIMINNGYGNGYISIKNTSSTNSGGKGFHILSHKNITIDGITATGSGEDGLYIDNCDFDWGNSVCKGNGMVKITGKLPNFFNNNTHNGVHILSGGTITLSNFQANENSMDGVYIEADFAGTSPNVTLNSTYKPSVGSWTNSASGNAQYGIQIESYGNILVDACTAEQNTQGAYLYTAGAPGAKSVTVKNSSFSSNAGTGLEIGSNGTVTINDVHAYQNTTGYGIRISNSSGTGNVSVTGSKTTICDFSGNGNIGIRVTSAGVITVKNILATGNLAGGYFLNTAGEGKPVTIINADFSDSTGGSGLQVSSNGAIFITDIHSNNNNGGQGGTIYNYTASKAQLVRITGAEFNANGSGYGLSISSLGAVTLSGVQANENSTRGASIDVCNYDGGIPGCKSTGALTITGSNNQFSGNGTDGLYINARSSVILNNVAINENGGSGLYIWNNYNNSTGNINLNASKGGANSVSYNGSYGIYIESYGNITLQRFDASNNGSYGAYISNSAGPAAKKVTITYATINDNQGTGLQISSTGAVSFTAVQVLRSSKYFWEINDDNGMEVYDRLPFDQVNDEIWWFNGSNSQSLTIDLASSTFDAYLELFDENWNLLDADDNSGGDPDAQITYTLTSDGTYYLRVSSAVEGEYGDYTLSVAGSSPGYAYYNNSGVVIDNRFNNGTGGVTISAPKGSYGLDSRDNNYNGLDIYSNGTISLSGAEIKYNGGNWGAQIGNSGAEGKPINLKNCYFDNNDGVGVTLNSKGVVTWTSGSASRNSEGYGTAISNQSAGAYRAVNLSNVAFNENKSYGFTVYSLGSITLKNVGASDNETDRGATLDNCNASGTICAGYGNVTLLGTYGMNEYNNNGNLGISIVSRGTISLTNVNASGNVFSGINLNNDYDNAYGNILVKSSSRKTNLNISSNGSNGIYTVSMGTITLSNIDAHNNSGNGLEVANGDAMYPKKVSISRILASENTNHGVFVSSAGAIDVSYMESYSNGGNGIALSNWSVADPQSVTVTRTKIDGHSGSHGLLINSKGNVTLNNVSSTNNDYGAYIDNAWGTDSKVTVLGSMGDNTFSGNSLHGLYIQSHGNVSLTSIAAESNGNDGVRVMSDGTLTASKLWIARNAENGFYAVANLGATITGLQSYNNGSASDGAGLFLQMNMGSLAKITKSAFIGNYGNGIYLDGDANPLLTGTYYFGNDANNTGDANLVIH